MQNIIVTTAKGNMVTLRNAHAYGPDHIAHDGGLYVIREGDAFKNVPATR